MAGSFLYQDLVGATFVVFEDGESATEAIEKSVVQVKNIKVSPSLASSEHEPDYFSAHTVGMGGNTA